MRLSLPALVCVVVAVASTSNAAGQQIDVRQLMTPAEFEETGLEKLTADELENLNEWLLEFALRVHALSEQQAASTPSPSGGVIESHIEGEFTGWDGETIFRLTNGQIWQQVSYAYVYHYAYRPAVLIYRSGSSYRMKVDGVSSEITVRRLR